MNAPAPKLLAASIIGAFVLGSVIDLLPNLSWHDQQRMVQLTWLFALFAIWAVACGRNAGPVTAPLALPVMAISAIAAIGAVSAGAAPLGSWAWKEWALLISLSLAILLVSDLRKQQQDEFDRWIGIAIGVVCVLIVIRFLATYIGGLLAGGPLDTKDLSALGFSNRRFLGQLQTLTIPLLAIPLLKDRGPKGTAWVLLSSSWMLAFVSATRGTFFGIGVAAVFAVNCLGASGRRWARYQFIALAAGLLAYVLLFVVVPWWSGVEVLLETRAENFSSSSGRSEVWLHTLALIREHPLLGVGPMHFAYFRSPGNFPAHPHNALLQLMAEWGIPAALLAFACILWGLTRLLRHARQAPTNPVVVCLAFGLIGSVSQSFVDGVFVMPFSQTFLVLLSGWAMGAMEASRGSPGSNAQARALGAAFIAPLVIVTTYAAADVSRLEDRNLAYAVTHGSYTHPRFWQQGWLEDADP